MESKSKFKQTNQTLNELFLSLKTELPEFFPKNPTELKKMVIRTSDQFLFKENKSQWSQPWFQAGYLNYFMPMQYARINKALLKTLEVYPGLEEEISSIVDFGAGPGPAALVFNHYFKSLKWTNIDINENANNIARKIYSQENLEKVQFKKSSSIPISTEENQLLILSYSLCEGISEENIFGYDHIFILEPSTKESSRKLMELRQKALSHGFNVIAPCTHCMECPLLERKSDWCHDRVEKPSLTHLQELNLPFSEKSLSFSYLFLSKKIRPQSSSYVRVVGDFLKEKGKTKVGICQNNERQFLSWLKRSKYSPSFSRGDLVKIPANTLIKGQEIRISAD